MVSPRNPDGTLKDAADLAAELQANLDAYRQGAAKPTKEAATDDDIDVTHPPRP
jgi:hypothetical protein